MNLFYLLILLFPFLITCQKSPKSTEKERFWKGLPQQVITQEEVQEEIQEKMARIQQFMKEEDLGGVLLTQVRNVRWITAGLTNTQIVLNKDVGAASLLIKSDGSRYLICTGSEADRLMNESLRDLGYQLKMYNWYEANPLKDVRGEIIRELSDGSKIGSDTPFPNTVLIAKKFRQLRYRLTDPEIKRYSWLGKQVAEAVETICRRLKPGMDEFQIEALTAAELRSRGIFPTVLLIGVDRRIYQYRHALPGGAKLKKYAMVNVVAEKWGMPVAVTRFVYFGNLPEDLKNKLEKTAIVSAHYQAATVPGKSCAEIFTECQSWYAQVGFEGEWRKHHQGGAIGYDDREYVIYPDITEVVHEKQAFAWNPTITGAKVEDTIIAFKDSIRVITHTGNWPMLKVRLNGRVFPQPGILLKDPQTGEIIVQQDIEIQ